MEIDGFALEIIQKHNNVQALRPIDSMVLEQLRKSWEKSLDPILEKYDWISPSTITWIALPIGLLAAILSWFAPMGSEGGWWFLGSAALIGIAMIFDGLDGPIARKKGMVSRWGDYLDHTFDRILDAAWLIGLSASVYVDNFALGFAAAFFTLLGSYMGTQAQAVSGTRNYGGFSRADRTILIILMLTIMGVVTLADYPFNDRFFAPFDTIALNPLSVVLFVSLFGGLWTFFLRFFQAQKVIQSMDANKPLSQPKVSFEEE
jgi:archaetidylinositol phosphate synthase